MTQGGSQVRKRILFVDEDRASLQALKAQLQSYGGAWDLTFAEGGVAALGLLDGAPFDVVVSELIMAGISGADLLQQVMKRHPRCVRLILTRQADPQAALKCVGFAHQFFGKPLDPESLKSALRRISRADGTIDDERLKRLVARIDRVPSVPALYSAIVEQLQRPDAGLEDVGSLIAQDPGMTVTMLKLVNSTFFGLNQRLEDPVDAVRYLGVEMVKSLVLMVHAFSQYDGCRFKEFSMEALWDHSMETAALARAIAEEEGADRYLVNAASVAGMLHDVGKLVFAANFTEEYRAVLNTVSTGLGNLLDAERAAFGATHADVAGYLLGLWGLPEMVVEAIALHHNPVTTEMPLFSALTAVHVADVLVHARHQPLPSEPSIPLDLEYLARLDLARKLELWSELEIATAAA